MARPSKLTPHVADQIVLAVKGCAAFKAAAAARRCERGHLPRLDGPRAHRARPPGGRAAPARGAAQAAAHGGGTEGQGRGPSATLSRSPPRGTGLSKAGRADVEWRLKSHLLPWFADMKLTAITVEEVDRFKLAKARERKEIADAAARGWPIIDEYTDGRGCKHRRPRHALSNTSINKLLGTLAGILEVAVEYGHIKVNPAQGRRRRLPSKTPPPPVAGPCRAHRSAACSRPGARRRCAHQARPAAGAARNAGVRRVEDRRGAGTALA